MLESFRIRAFRFQWAADAFASWASEMETLLLGWYVLVDTGSPFLVGLVGALRFGGTLLAPLYGVVADRVDRRTLLAVMRVLQALQAALIMALALTGTLRPWHAFAISTVGGLLRMGENVVRQSLIADVVPPGSLMNAVSLSRTTMDATKMIGAIAGASLLSQLGMGAAYVAVTVCYLLSTVLLAGVSVAGAAHDVAPAGVGPDRSPAGPRHDRPGVRRDLRSGLGYMRDSSTIVAIMFLAFLVNLTVFPLTNGLMPVVARDAFGFGPTGLALLLTAVSIGAVAGSLLLAAITARVKHPERTMLASIAAWHALLLVFVQVAHAEWAIGAAAPLAVPVAIPLGVLAAYGAATSGSMVTMSAVLLSTTAVAFRGRVMGVRMMAVYGLPMGLLLGGFLAERIGIHQALTVLALVGLALTLVATLRWPALLRSPAGRRVAPPAPTPPAPPAPPAPVPPASAPIV